MKGTEYEYFMSSETSTVMAERYYVMVNSDELTDTTDYLTLWMRYGITRRRYNRVPLHS